VSRRFTILVCRGPECGEKRHSAELHARFAEELRRCPLGDTQVTLDLYSCFGRCQRGPNVLVRELKASDSPTFLRLMPTAGHRAVIYHGVRPSEVRRVLEEHVVGGQQITELIERVPAAAPEPADARGAKEDLPAPLPQGCASPRTDG
jgi:(2Fe-2S) ferredoxin